MLCLRLFCVRLHRLLGFFAVCAFVQPLFEVMNRTAEVFADVAQFLVPNIKTTIISTIIQCVREKLPMMYP